jgi:hypothetical protein
MVKETKVTMFLAEHAQVAEGKLNVIGGGWTVIGQPQVPYYIAMLIEMPWSSAGVKHTVKLELIDDEGRPVTVETPEGNEEPVVIAGQFDVAPALGTKRGTPLVLPSAVAVPPYPLTPGARFEWRLEVNGDTHEDWRVGFSTQPEAQSNVG